MTDELTPNGLARLARSAAAYHLDKAQRRRAAFVCANAAAMAIALTVLT